MVLLLNIIIMILFSDFITDVITIPAEKKNKSERIPIYLSNESIKEFFN